MRLPLPPLRSALAFVLATVLLSCGDAPTSPFSPEAPRLSHSVTVPQVVISQIYGGGGNTNATHTHDFIELYNPGSQAVSLADWSVQYAGATGTSWQRTDLSGTIQPGGYYLIQQAPGTATGTFLPLPDPDATGSIPMALGAGKVWLVSTTATLSGACPTTGVVDKVSYGTTASDCGFSNTSTLSNTTAAHRKDNGCTYTEHLRDDFFTATPAPRNSSSPTYTCSITASEPATVTVSPDEPTIAVGQTQALTAAAFDDSNNPVSTTFTWSSDEESVATVDEDGVASGLAPGTATITATTDNGISGSATLTVTPPVVIEVVISQVYGGGGNSGALYKNDFIELFNRGDDPVNLSGWSVQYTSAAGTGTWQVTPLSGILQPGHHYLVQEAAGAGGTLDLPAPDAIGTIPMAAGAGKVWLVQSSTALSGVCPTGSSIIDRVSYGSTASDCGIGRTANLSNTTAALRKNDGCVKTDDLAADFIVQAPNPRNSSSPRRHCTQPERTQSTATIVINELMGDPANAESASWGQWFEVHNHGSTAVNLEGWTIVTDGTSQPDHTITSSVVVPAGGFAVLGRGGDITRNGGVNLNYNYFTGNATTIWLDDSDFLMLVDGDGARVDSVAWTGLPRGATKGLRSVSNRDPNVDGPAWGYPNTTFGDGDYGTPGTANGTLSDTPPFVSPNRITVVGRTSTDAPLPVGFEAQLFATERDPNNQIVETEFTWMSLTPAIASIDQRGVMRGLAPGLATFRVVSATGAFRNHAIVMETPVASTTADYLNSTEFGDPVDNDPSDDFIVRRPQFTTSWNGGRGIPNWVAYNLNATHSISGADRCNCFTFDPQIAAAGFQPYNTADYTGVGGSAPFHGFPIDRGHLVRSADRTTGTLDNAVTFYFSNVLPQAADLNQGPWSDLEFHLADLARNQGREVYIYAGGSGFTGLTIKNEGRIAIPAWNWKVAVVMPRGQGLADVRDYRDVQVISAVMPNVHGIRNQNWQTQYVVTADSVEKLSGYRLLGALPGNIQRALKLGNMPPIAKVDGPYVTAEDAAVTMSGAESVDPNGTITGYTWLLGDGSTRSGATVTHTYALSGSYIVRLIVTDNDGLVDTATTVAHVSQIPAPAGLQNLVSEVNQLVASGKLSQGNGNSLNAKLSAAAIQLERDNMTPFVQQIEAFINEVTALEQARRMSAADAERLRFLARRLIRAASS